jgi:metal-responsive CopG/Arc/MetJ family transcriptional regulator
LVARLDERAGRLRRTRSSLIREALESYLHDDVEAELDRQIVDGYTRVPQDAEELRWAQASAREAIGEEPW